MKYNEETHYIQVMIDGEWVDYKYFNPNESVALIPLMSGDTSPFGVASSSSNFVTSGNVIKYSYLAFDQNDSTDWYANGTAKTFDEYLQYEFPEEVTITKFETKGAGFSTGGSVTKTYGTIQILSSLDGNTWDQVYSMTMESHTGETFLPNTIELDKAINCKYIKLKIDGYGWLATCYTLQAYGYK